jgi:hypothetical protein
VRQEFDDSDYREPYTDKDIIIVPKDECVTLTREEYNKLLEAKRFLRALEAAGVDNWEGYDIAKDILEKD